MKHSTGTPQFPMPIQIKRRLRILMALLFIFLIQWTATQSYGDEKSIQKGGPNQQIAEIEKKIQDLQNQLSELKKSLRKPLSMNDLASWKSILSPILSLDGNWFACSVGELGNRFSITPKNAKLILKSTDKGTSVPVEEKGVPGSLQFSNDSRYFSSIFSQGSEGSKAILVELKNGKKTEFLGVNSLEFAGDEPKYIALYKTPQEGSKDLIIREIATGKEVIFGNVDQYEFDKKGSVMILLLSSKNPAGNGVQLYDLQKGTIRSLEIDSASFSQISWNKEKNAFVLLKEKLGKDGKSLTPPVVSILGFKNITMQPEMVIYDPVKDSSFPKGKMISKSKPRWTEDLTGIIFEVQSSSNKSEDSSKQKDSSPAIQKRKKRTLTNTLDGSSFSSGKEFFFEEQTYLDNNTEIGPSPRVVPSANLMIQKEKTTKEKNAIPEKEKVKENKIAQEKKVKSVESKKEEPSKKDLPKTNNVASGKADVVIWHHSDHRLQSEQQKRAGAFSRQRQRAIYWIKEKKLVVLESEKLLNLTIAPKDQWALGSSIESYERSSGLDGKSYEDVVLFNTHTGEKKVILAHYRNYRYPVIFSEVGGSISPDGNRLLYYQNGHYHIYEFATGKSVNITQGVPASFVDKEDDHNVEMPPTPSLGWSSDSQKLFLSDGWDIYLVSANAKDPAKNMTENGKASRIRYQRLLQWDPDTKGIDLTKPIFVGMFGEDNKRQGYGKILPNKMGVHTLLWEEAAFSSLLKAEKGEQFIYRRETCNDYPNYFTVKADFKAPIQLTDANPQQADYLWCSGAKLIHYTNDRGQKLTANLLLPSNYDPNKSYPTIVYIYEKLSQRHFNYLMPGITMFNPCYYTSNGYAILMPDITYKLNDPGKSSLECVLPALKAAIESKVVDAKRVGLHGHSWGGYQTAFLITQTKAFRAAIAGAPLTDLVSMYSSIYWNIGIPNQPIFESSQGRFTGSYLDQLDAYIRNSPVFQAKNVETPLIILHNDKDGAVDWNQGIEYFNILRRLNKSVIMLQYRGENHGLSNPNNVRDYFVRMKEFFDHYLMDKSAPDWMKDGVPFHKLSDHLDQRAKGGFDK